MINDLYEKYDNRVKNFIMEMIQSPIKVKEYINPIESTRKELFEEEDSKIKGRRGLILKGFKTEKERIKEHLQNLNFIFTGNSPRASGENKTSNSANHSDLNNHLNDGSIVLQPQMRFKPRTDLERIYEEINKNSYGAVNKHIVDRQLKELDLNVMKKNEKTTKEENLEEFEYEIFKTVDMNRNNYESVLKEEQKKEEEEKIKKQNKHKRKIDINSDAKNFMKDLHNKTHFKGASVIANNLESLLQSNSTGKIKRNNSREKEDKIFKAILEEASNGDVNFSSNYNSNNSHDNAYPPEFKINFNPMKHLSCDHLNLKSLDQVQKLAFSDNMVVSLDTESSNKKKVKFISKMKNTRSKNTTSIISPNISPKTTLKTFMVFETPAEEFTNKKDDDRIVIDNQPIPRNRIDLIASKILNRCNFNNSKNKNNNKVLKAGDGKLMITNGMSVSEFENKYKL